MQLPPSKISTDGFWSSPFENSECETILRNVVLQQALANPDAWTPFTWDQYKAFCTHSVWASERDILDTFVNGGKPVWNTSAYLQAGWMDFNEDAKEYSLTERMIEMLSEKYPAQ